MPIPEQYRAPIKTWLRNHAYKAVKTADENWEYRVVPDSDPVEYVLTDPVDVPALIVPPVGEPSDDESYSPGYTVPAYTIPGQRIKDVTSTITYLDVPELFRRLRAKILKATPATPETLTLEDMEELFNPYVPTIRAHLGVDAVGGVPYDMAAIDAEDPDE
jgi:hypothetical protein